MHNEVHGALIRVRGLALDDRPLVRANFDRLMQVLLTVDQEVGGSSRPRLYQKNQSLSWMAFSADLFQQSPSNHGNCLRARETASRRPPTSPQPDRPSTAALRALPNDRRQKLSWSGPAYQAVEQDEF